MKSSSQLTPKLTALTGNLSDYSIGIDDVAAGISKDTRLDVIIKKSTISATAPTVNDDSSLEYSVFSLWYNTTTDIVYICKDATVGAAVWEPINANLVTTGITASTTQSQGQQPLNPGINEVSIVANIDDTVTMPPAVVGRKCKIINSGANRLQVFPDAGHSIDNESLNDPITIIEDTSVTYDAINSTNWYS